jgi:hypothetical protein
MYWHRTEGKKESTTTEDIRFVGVMRIIKVGNVTRRRKLRKDKCTG